MRIPVADQQLGEARRASMRRTHRVGCRWREVYEPQTYRETLQRASPGHDISMEPGENYAEIEVHEDHVAAGRQPRPFGDSRSMPAVSSGLGGPGEIRALATREISRSR